MATAQIAVPSVSLLKRLGSCQEYELMQKGMFESFRYKLHNFRLEAAHTALWSCLNLLEPLKKLNSCKNDSLKALTEIASTVANFQSY